MEIWYSLLLFYSFTKERLWRFKSPRLYRLRSRLKMENLLRAPCLRAALVKILFIRDSLSRSSCLGHRSKSLARSPELFVRCHCAETFVIFVAPANTIGHELNEQNSIVLDVTSGDQWERGKRGGKEKERERARVQIDWTIDHGWWLLLEASPLIWRFIGALRGTRGPTMCLECCAEIAGEWRRRSWLE